MQFDTKIAVVVREDLPTWQKLNMTAFLISGIAGTQELVGEPYEDASGNRYLPMCRQPILVFAGEKMAVPVKGVSANLDLQSPAFEQTDPGGYLLRVRWARR